jgi:ABC-2 type transport system ATP-binding protein
MVVPSQDPGDPDAPHRPTADGSVPDPDAGRGTGPQLQADGGGVVAAGSAGAGAADPAVVIEGATMRFDEDTAVDGISLTVLPGTILGVIGPSGSGKTTTIRMLTGALAPTEGRVRVLGEDPRQFRRATRERIGYMPQQFTLYPDLTARENVDFVASLFGLLFWRRHRRTRQVLQLVDLWDVRGRRAGNLSGGMQRRLELACALVHEPQMMFLDEPTAGIDPLLRVRVWEELHRLRDEGRTLLVTTQYINEAESCDTVALIADGRLIALGTPDELRREAMGGDVVAIETTEPFDGRALSSMPSVHGVTQQGERSIRIAVDDAAVAMAEVVEVVLQHGGEVATVQEARPSFDEVFAVLVQRERSAPDAPDDERAA